MLSQNPAVSTRSKKQVYAINSKNQIAAARKQGFETYTHFLKSGFNDSWTMDGIHPTWAAQQINGMNILNHYGVITEKGRR